MKFPIVIQFVKPADARGWIGIGCYLLVVFIFLMMWTDKALLKDDFFKVLATAIVLTGWNQGPVGWAYQATQGGGEAARSNAKIAENSVTNGKSLDEDKPTEVVVINKPNDPVPTTKGKAGV